MRRAFSTNDVSRDRVMSKDPLTELFNRRYLLEWLRPNFKLYMRQQRLMGCLMLKIDNFKSLYDSYGKDRGDFILKDFATLSQMTFRDSDILVRYDGDEFVIILPDSGMDGCLIAANRLQKIMNFNAVAAFQPGEITCSMVVSSWSPEMAVNGEELLQEANMRLANSSSFEKNQIMALTRDSTESTMELQ